MDTLILRPDGMDYKFSIRLSIAGCKPSEEEVGNYIDRHFWCNSLLVTGNAEIMEVSMNTDKPWEILEYSATLGDIFNITIDNKTCRQNGRKIEIK